MEMEWVWRGCLNGNFVSDELGKVLDSFAEQKPKQRYHKFEDLLADLGSDNSLVFPTQKYKKIAKISAYTNVKNPNLYRLTPVDRTQKAQKSAKISAPTNVNSPNIYRLTPRSKISVYPT